MTDDVTSIGLDSTGHDWKTVGYWATLRSSSPLDSDDGYNFLRIHRTLPLDIHYWEIGNEVFGDGFFDGGNGFEEDLHVAYSGADPNARKGHELLSPRMYGKGVVAYAEAMKAVDRSKYRDWRGARHGAFGRTLGGKVEQGRSGELRQKR